MTPYSHFNPISAQEVLSLYRGTPRGELTISERVLRLEHLYKAQLENIHFEQCGFEGTTLEDANLNFAKLFNCSITDCHLSGASLINVETENLTIVNSSMSGTQMPSAFLNQALFQSIKEGENVDFSLSELIEARADHCSFPRSHFVDVEAAFSTFFWCDFTGAELRESNFGGATFEHCQLDGADLAWVNLTDATFSGTSIQGTNLYGATLRGAALTRDQLVTSGSLGSIKGACETAFRYLGVGTCRELLDWLLVKSDEPLLRYLNLPENDENLELQKKYSAARNFIVGCFQGREEEETWVGTPISQLLDEWLTSFLSSY